MRSTESAAKTFNESFAGPARDLLAGASEATPSSALYDQLGELAAAAHRELEVLPDGDKCAPKLAPIRNASVAENYESTRSSTSSLLMFLMLRQPLFLSRVDIWDLGDRFQRSFL